MATSRSNTPTPDDIELVKELTRLYEQALGISEKDARARAETARQAGTLNKEIKILNTQMHEVVFQSDYLFQSFRDQTSELKSQNNLLNIGKSTYKGLTDIAQDLNYFQKGITDLTDKQFKKVQSSLGIQEENLDTVVKTLANSQGEYINQSRLAKLQATSADDLSDAQKRRLKELTQEKQLLEAAQDTIKNGIPVLKNELNISKQIYKVKEDAGGLAKAVAGTISKYGGELSRFLKVDDAIESVNEYNKKLIDGALRDKKVQGQLIDIENKKLNIQEQLETGRFRDEKTGKFVKATEEERLKRQNQLNSLEQEGFNIKSKAIASVDTLGNKFNSLGVLIKGLGTGIKKAITDPLTVMTFLIDQGLKANKQVTDLGKSLGVSYREANKLREEFVQYSRVTNDTFVTTDRLLKAQADLSEQLGIAVQFSGEELTTFSKLTEIVGLSAQEAGKLATFSAAAGVGTKEYVKQIRLSVFASNQANKTHFSDKLILQDISKLSAGILVKFQGNPKALADAAFQTRKLGLSLEQVDKVGDSLLNWESSIENELKAQLLTGKQLNLEKARYLALTGSQAELAQEIANQAGSLADFNNMNVIAQKSLAEAFGMSRDELADMLMKQEAINTYGKEAEELNAQQLKDFKKSGLSLADYITKQAEQQSAQEKFNDAIDKLKDLIGNLVAGPLGTFIDVLSKSLSIVNSIGSALSFLETPLKAILSLYIAIKGVQLGLNIAGGAKSFGSSILTAAKSSLEFIKTATTKGIGSAISGIGGDKAKDAAEKAAGAGDKAGAGGPKAGEGIKNTLKGISAGIQSFKKVTPADIAKLAFSALALVALTPAIPALLALQFVNGKLIQGALTGLGKGLAALGKALASGQVILGIAVLTASMIGLGYALKLAAPGIEAFGKAIKSTFEGIGEIITAAAGGISTIFTSLQNVDVAKLLAIGPALIGIGVGLASLGAGGVIGAIGAFLSGDPIKKLQGLAASGDGLIKTATALQSIAGALVGVAAALAAIDVSKLEALDEFSSNQATNAAVKGITDFFTAPIKAIGEAIGGGKEKINPTIGTNPISNPNTNFESTIKPNIASPLDLTPFINAFTSFKNEVITAMNRQQPTPQFALHVDGKQLGTVVGKQMETGTSQNIYTGYRIA